MLNYRKYNPLCMDSEVVQQGKNGNIIPPPEKEPLWKGFLKKFTDPIIIVLLVAFVLSLGVSFYEIYALDRTATVLLEPLGVLVALLLATGIGFIFEVKAEREFDLLNKVKDSRAVKVIRCASLGDRPRMYEIKRANVVPGDIVKLEPGDEVPADGVLLFSQDLRMDESNFTGEVETVKSANEAEFRPDATYPTNFMLRGTTVIEGSGIFRVTAVGLNTEEGKGVKITREGSEVKTPLNQQLDVLGKQISVASFVVAALILVGRMMYFFFWDGNAANNHSLLSIAEFALSSIMIAVTLIVVAVPEGLPMSITVSLAMSMRKMLKENNLVRKLHACETMGATTVICTDKTGTLTCNRMTVVDAQFYGDTPQDIINQSIALNTTAALTENEDGTLTTVGNPTEGALLRWIAERGADYQTLRDEVQITAQQPFSTETKFMSTTVTMPDGRQATFVKGAPEIVFEQCSAVAGGVSREQIREKLLDYQKHAMRTLGFAYRASDSEPLTFIGIVGIADPVRPDVKEAIHICRDSAGVRVIIVTGDTPGTAREIGRQIGLITDDSSDDTISGTDFAALSDEQADAILDKIKIIARARPHDKSRLVELLQRRGEVVAVTGDGTNDAPALSKAQVGLSMGDGTARAKEASDITIIDNSFSSINKAIMWGRSIYMNIRRFLIFQMTINVCACLIVLMGAFTGLDSPLTVTQMLWVNLIMDTFAAAALSSLPANPNVLRDKPRSPSSHIINRSMSLIIFTVGALFFLFMAGVWQLLWHCDISSVSQLLDIDHLKLYFSSFNDMSHIKEHLSPYEMSVFFTTFVMLQFWNIFNARYYRTGRCLLLDLCKALRCRHYDSQAISRGFWLIVAAIFIGQVLIVQFGGEMFNVAPLSLSDWTIITLATMVPVFLLPELWCLCRYLLKKDKNML